MNKSVNLADMFPLISEQLESGGSTSFTIHGTSMRPMLKDRVDSVRLKKPLEAPKKYDVIFYRRDNGGFVLHRVVGVRQDGFICRGDNQIVDEYPVKLNSVIGIVTDYTKNGEWKPIGCFSQKLYARFWVNTVLFRKAKRRLWLWGHNTFKGNKE